MHPLQNGSQDTSRPPKKPLSGGPGWFTESGDNNVPSYPGADWFNHVIAEFQNMLAAQGIMFDPENDDHLQKAFTFVFDSITSRQEESVSQKISDVTIDDELGEESAVRLVDELNASERLYNLNPFRSGIVQGYDASKKLMKIDGNYSRMIGINESTKNIFKQRFKPSSIQYFNNSLFHEVTTESDSTPPGDEIVYFYAPTSCTLPSGRIITAYTAKLGQDIDPGQVDNMKMEIHVKISDDNCLSFQTKKAVVKPLPYQCSESVIYYDELEKRTYIFYTSFKGQVGWGFSQPGNDENISSQIEFVYSDDHGDSWSNPVNITAAIKPSEAWLVFTPPTKIARNKYGQIMVPISYTEQPSSSVVETYAYNDGDSWLIGETITKETDSQTGGEIGFGRRPDGSVFAISRSYYDNPIYGYRTSIHKLYDEIGGHWTLKGQFETSDCKSSWVVVGDNDGFDGYKLLLIAPIGTNGTFDGRKNLRCFDATVDFSNPVDLGMISDNSNDYSGYSDLVLMSNGCFASLFDGRQWRVHCSSFTLNRLRGAQGEMVPCYGIKLVDSLSDNLKLDMQEHEQVLLKGTSETYIYRLGDFRGFNTSRELTVTQVSNSLDASLSDIFYFSDGSSGSIVGEIFNGYVGQEITLISLSGLISIELQRLKPGSGQYNRITFNDHVSGSSTFTRLLIAGSPNSALSIVKLKKTEYGWYANSFANTL
ncbi:sialidase family protein [Vibrio sp. L3-7]|uniref:sialidase family protein n=1 Tax=Vibrio sp. L3-7 TaxID=2912253 RepID=UPI001F20558F|nr:sialidase family protein [Vibrio sp. L3-7]MCF7502706.1 glycoside hydrolase [Vibrio sp. L3-7]